MKRSRSLGNVKQSTKSKEGESAKLSAGAQDVANDAVYDFLYVDRVRVSALYSQLFPEGTLTSIRTTAQKSFTDDQNIGTDIKVLKAEARSIDFGSEGIEHSFDTSWSIPVEVLAELSNRGRVGSDLKNPKLGNVVLQEAFLRIIDYSTMKDLWEPAITIMGGGERNAPGMKEFLALMKHLPNTMHAHFLASEELLWASLNPQYLTVPNADIVLKYGGHVSGSWKVLFMVDAFPDDGREPTSWAAGEATEAILRAIHALRSQIGRPNGWFGITPLLIFREILASTHQASLALERS